MYNRLAIFVRIKTKSNNKKKNKYATDAYCCRRDKTGVQVQNDVAVERCACLLRDEITGRRKVHGTARWRVNRARTSRTGTDRYHLWLGDGSCRLQTTPPPQPRPEIRKTYPFTEAIGRTVTCGATEMSVIGHGDLAIFRTTFSGLTLKRGRTRCDKYKHQRDSPEHWECRSYRVSSTG